MTKPAARTGREPVFMRILVASIDPGKNVRLDDDDALVGSIARWGVLQPITVVPSPTDPKRVECMFGHRRLAAARKLGLDTIPALGHQRATEQTRMLMQIAENRDRQPMTILEEALTFRELRETGMTAAQIAKSVGVSEGAVSDKLRLLAYPEAIQHAVHGRRLPLTDALSIPIQLARDTAPTELAAVCRGGGAGVRDWVRRMCADHAEIVRTRVGGSTLGCDADTADLIRALARGRKESVAAWLRRVANTEIERVA